MTIWIKTFWSHNIKVTQWLFALELPLVSGIYRADHAKGQDINDNSLLSR